LSNTLSNIIVCLRKMLPPPQGLPGRVRGTALKAGRRTRSSGLCGVCFIQSAGSGLLKDAVVE
jgi:hypothetical protein